MPLKGGIEQHSEHWEHTAAERLVWRWNSSAMASMGPDQKTNGDQSPIRMEGDEVKRVWLQLHKYLAQCQFDIQICRGSLRAAQALVSSAVHLGPVEPKASSGLSLAANTLSKWLKLRSLQRWTISCGNCDGNSHPVAITRVKQLQNHKQNCDSAMETQNTITGGWFLQLCARVNNSVAKETTKRQNKT